MQIEPYDASKLDAVIRLSLRAWEPVFESIRNTLDPDVFREHYPDWRQSQRNAVAAACADENVHVRVAVQGPDIAGFVALKLYQADRMGVIVIGTPRSRSARTGLGPRATTVVFDRAATSSPVSKRVCQAANSVRAPTPVRNRTTSTRPASSSPANAKAASFDSSGTSFMVGAEIATPP